jgi:hypothetical protein
MFDKIIDLKAAKNLLRLVQDSEVEKQIPKDDEVLVGIHASSLNYGDNASFFQYSFNLLLKQSFFSPCLIVFNEL